MDLTLAGTLCTLLGLVTPPGPKYKSQSQNYSIVPYTFLHIYKMRQFPVYVAGHMNHFSDI